VGDIFAVQDEIVAAVLGAIAPALLRFEQLQALARPKAEQTVWDRLYRGSFHLSKQTDEATAEAIAVFDEVIAHSPEVAVAHAGRSLAALGVGIRCVGESQLRPLDADEGGNALRRGLDAFGLAERRGRRAVELDDLDWTAHTALGWALMFQGRAGEALAPLERAVELNPSSATACFALGTLHLRGDADEAAPLLARAVRLSPRDPLVHMMYGALSGAALLRGDFEAAFEAARRSVALEPEGGFSFRPALAVALAHLGREEEAKAVVEEVFRRAPEFNLGITRLVAPPRLIERIEEAFARLGLEIA
jgi:adenylate cyclase